MDLVELQQGRQVVELLVPDLEAAVGQRVDDVVRHPRVLGHGQYVVPGAGGRIADQEHAVALALEPGLRLLARHGPHVPGRAVRGVEPGGGHGGPGAGPGGPGLLCLRWTLRPNRLRAGPGLWLTARLLSRAGTFLAAAGPQHPPHRPPAPGPLHGTSRLGGAGPAGSRR